MNNPLTYIAHDRLPYIVVGGILCIPLAVQADDRPNIVWYMMEDVAPHFMAAYNNGTGAQMSNFQRVADEGLLFENAYSCAPVSSAARSTLITGRYAPRVGIGCHRTAVPVRLPEGTSMFPALLRQAGYHTSNANKTDYNCELDSAAWDIVHGQLGDWRKRPTADTPFFFVRTNGACHESCLHFTDTSAIADTGQPVRLMPQHPDTPLMRKTYRQFYKSLDKCDAELGKLLDMLEEDGLSDNTILFCFGDNGGSLPGSKGYLTETGLKVPLAVYIPEKWRKAWGYAPATHVSGIVDFTDFSATLLHLAGCEIPSWIDGTPFLGDGISGDDINAGDETLGYADRFDELYAFSRTIRKGNYKYVRNYYPYAPASLMATYRYRQMAFKEWHELYGKGTLDSIQTRFFMPQGPEALYDLSKDPYETHDLSRDPDFGPTLAAMRRLLADRLDSLCDVGILPEYMVIAESGGCPGEYGPRIKQRLKSLRNLADLQLESGDVFQKAMARHLSSSDEAERYWAAANAIWFSGQLPDGVINDISAAYSAERSPAVKSKLLTAGIISGRNDTPEFEQLLTSARSEAELLQILNDMAYLHERLDDPAWTFLSNAPLPFDSENIRWRLAYLFAKP